MPALLLVAVAPVETQVILLIFGTATGVGVAAVLLSRDLPGVPRQVVLFHGAMNALGGLVCVGAVFVEHATGWPLLIHGLGRLPGSEQTPLSAAFLVLMLVVASLSVASAGRAPAWLLRWAPPTPEQDLSRPQHLADEALADTESALDLMAREQAALVARLPDRLQDARHLRAGTRPAVDPAARRRAAEAVVAAIQDYGAHLADQPLTRATSMRLLGLERRLGVIDGLDDTLSRFAASAAFDQVDGALGRMADQLIEAADVLVLTAIDAMTRQDHLDIGLLREMTGDRSQMMDTIRRTHAESTARDGHQAQAALFAMTSLFERTVWLLQQVAVSLDHESAAHDGDAAARQTAD